MSVKKGEVMDKFIIEGARELYGEVEIQSSKNAVLPLLAASILTDEQIVIHKCPKISDVLNMLEILKDLGCKTTFYDDSIIVEASGIHNWEVSCGLAERLRSSIFMLGSILSRFGKAKIAYPGGCDIGLRPIDLHILGLKRLGVNVVEGSGMLECSCDELVGAEIVLDFPSVGATENVMLASVIASGTTVIKNSAKEPEIIDLQNFLNKMGAKVTGAGTSTLIIEGVKKLHGTEYTPISDRIEAGTFMIACAMASGEIEIKNCAPENVASLIHKLRENGCNIHTKCDKIYLQRKGKLVSAKIVETSPYPGFATDLQSQFMALSCISEGSTLICENLFETRYKHVPQLIKMGADITVKGKVALVRGVKKLFGADVLACDLRGGAALVCAGISAEGITTVSDISHIDRGYNDFEYKLKNLGVKIKRITV